MREGKFSMKKYHVTEKCRLCGSTKLDELYHNKSLPVAGIYFDSYSEHHVNVPLTVVICDECGLVQLRETINPSIYEQYHFIGNSSLSYEQHLIWVARQLVEVFKLENKRIFEIGASNGVLLKYLKDFGNNQVFGVEPSRKLCEDARKFEVNLEPRFFNREYVNDSRTKYDCVIVRHVLEHIHELEEFVQLIGEVLEENGMVVVEVPSLNEMIVQKNYSNIFHEHLNYFSEQTLNYLFSKVSLTPVYMKCVDIHGGAIFGVYKKGERGNVFTKEGRQLDRSEIRSFFDAYDQYYTRLSDKVSRMNAQNKRVHGFGASHRTFTILGCSNLTNENIPYIYDSNPFLHGKTLNGIGSMIVSPQLIGEYSPDVIVIFATSYEREIIELLRNQYGYNRDILSIKHGGQG